MDNTIGKRIGNTLASNILSISLDRSYALVSFVTLLYPIKNTNAKMITIRNQNTGEAILVLLFLPSLPLRG